MKALNKKLLRDLWRLKSQAIAIAFVVACGIATYVMSSTSFTSLLIAKETYYERYRFADVFAHAKRAPLSLKTQLQAIEGVRTVYPRIRFGVNLDVPGLDEPASGQIVSIPDEGEAPLNGVFLRRGRMLENGEVDAVLIGEAFANANNLNPGDVIGAIINGRKRWLKVAGVALSPEFVYTLSPGNLFPDDKRYGVLWMNRRALEAATNLDGAFNDLAVALRPDANPQQVMDEINLLIAPYGGTDAYGHKSHVSAWFVNNELT
ncbi:MAG: ABC transporter permease, partial [Sphingomonadales bacterium]|nr:ABC transporter permease [Sphingomonadales bacterium]